MKLTGKITLLLLAFACNQPTNQQPQTPNDLPVTNQSAAIMQQIKRANQYPDSTPLREAAIEVLDSIGALKEAIAQVDSLIKRDSLRAGYWTKKGVNGTMQPIYHMSLLLEGYIMQEKGWPRLPIIR